MKSREYNLILALYFGSPFNHYSTFHTLTNVGRKSAFSILKNVPALSYNSEVLQCQLNIQVTYCVFLSIHTSNKLATITTTLASYARFYSTHREKRHEVKECHSKLSYNGAYSEDHGSLEGVTPPIILTPRS